MGLERSTQTSVQRGLMANRLYLGLYLPRWATDCLKRHDKALAAAQKPLALYEKLNNAMRLVALDRFAEQAGLSQGQSLSDARAMVPGLIAQEIDHGFFDGLFGELADWHANASPIVSIVTTVRPYGDLMLDITGVSHLFGGEQAMLDHVTGRLAAMGLDVQGAIAPSVGAAWALSHYAPGVVLGSDGSLPVPQISHEESDADTSAGVPAKVSMPPQGHPRDQGGGRALGGLLDQNYDMDRGAQPVSGDTLEQVLAPLPVCALRISPMMAEGLRQMGLKTIGQLYGRERRGLQARFGAALLLRLDQALGAVEERLVPRLPVPDYYSERKFGEPIGLIDDVLMVTRDLAHRLSALLETAGLGAQTFHLMLFRVDHKVMQLSVNAARASRDAEHIARLFANRIERLVEDFDAGFGIEMIRLMASSVSEVTSVQAGAFETNDGAEDLDRLYDRITSRLGPEAVVRSKPVNSHIPERAVVLEPVVARTQDVPEAAFDPELARPLRLLPYPEPVTVVAEVPDGPPARMEWRKLSYRFVKASGPERVGVEWWQPGEGAFTRDYFVGEDEEGRRFWLFREGLYTTETDQPLWFLHGVFG